MSCRRRSGRPAVALVPAIAAAVALVLALVATSPGTPARAAWAPGGSLGGLGKGRVWQVAVDPTQPTTVLAATDKGVYRSADGARSFTPASLQGSRVWSVGFDVATPHLAIAALDGGGAARSDDGGTTWHDISTGLPSRSVRTLAFGNGIVAAGTGDGVAVTADGRSWRSAGLRGYDISALAIDAVAQPNGPSQPVLIAGTDSGPRGQADNFLFANPGPGPKWTPLTLPTHSAVVSSIAVSPRPATTIRSAVLVATNVGVYRDDDPTAPNSTWTQVFPGENAEDKTQTLTSLAASPVDPNLVFAGDDSGGSSGGKLMRSTDGGLTFNVADNGLPVDQHNVTALALAPVAPPLIIAAVNPAGKGGDIWAQTDGSVPPPAATAPPEGAAAPVALGPLPSFTPLPPTPPPTVTPVASPSRLKRAVEWPFPLSVEVFILLLGAYLVVRWYQRRLDVEGPP